MKTEWIQVAEWLNVGNEREEGFKDHLTKFSGPRDRTKRDDSKNIERLGRGAENELLFQTLNLTCRGTPILRWLAGSCIFRSGADALRKVQGLQHSSGSYGVGDIDKKGINDWIWGFSLYLRNEEKKAGSEGIWEAKWSDPRKQSFPGAKKRAILRAGEV